MKIGEKKGFVADQHEQQKRMLKTLFEKGRDESDEEIKKDSLESKLKYRKTY
ncbi:MAG: hypothetical protein LUC60_01250 [Lachnospiraceae bacterium]|nr:hypothetical protein [Lachnospiraceae bacterium]